MGRDKAFLPFPPRRLIDHQVATLRALGPAELLISGRPETDYAVAEARVVFDDVPDEGPLGGVIAVLAAATTPLVLVLAVDMPAMTPAFLGRLLGGASPGVGVVPRCQGRWEPLAAVYPRGLLPRARCYRQEGCRALQPLLQAAAEAGAILPLEVPAADAGILANLNSPTDLPPASTSWR
jgi:molybdopterin-guanine dinucleotide biosynthesis protein A